MQTISTWRWDLKPIEQLYAQKAGSRQSFMNRRVLPGLQSSDLALALHFWT